ncbi:MAG TPA: tetratricopeptide repeat protein [Kofleriaceae bacterium]|nr:tetratricopeptide repeat protein [Kofleriaceae bacterium]
MALAIDPVEQHLLSGGELLAQGRVKEACAALEAVLESRPEEPRALALLGLAHFREHQFDEAKNTYERLVALDPDDASYRLNLGLVYLKLGDASAAIDELSHSRKLDPSQVRAVSYLGLAYARAGDYSRAYEAFLHAGQRDLAREMAQFLDPSERERIAGGASATDEAPALVADEPDGAKPEPEAEKEAEAETKKPPAKAAIPSIGDGVVSDYSDDHPGAITMAVASALPSVAATAPARTVSGGAPSRPLSELATARLLRPEDSGEPFEIGHGGVLIIRVADRVLSRTEGVIVSGGDLAYEPATQRVRGAQSAEIFGGAERPVFIVTGSGHLIAAPLGERFTAVRLDDDILYLREDLVFAFEHELHWENGHVPGADATIRVVQLRGEGCVALRTRRPPLTVKLTPDSVLYVDADVLAGWIGRVVPRVVAPAAGGKSSAPFVECTGEGVVLIEDLETDSVDPPPSS